MAYWWRPALALLAIVSVACGGSPSSSPTSPTSLPAPTVAPSPSIPDPPLALGQAAATGSRRCPIMGTDATACSGIVVACPSIPDGSATLGITQPPPTVANRGTIILTTGAEGVNFFNDSFLSPGMIATLAAEGLTAVQVRWDAPGIWGDARARTFACRYATAVKWIYDNVHLGTTSTLFAAQGTSGGAAQIAFGLAHYGLGDILDLAILAGGPPTCPLCPCDHVTANEPLLPVNLDFDLCSQPPPSTRNPMLSYPTTAVRFLTGDQDVGNPTIDHGKRYYDAITSVKSYAFVADTPHVIDSTPAGINAIVSAVRAAMK